MVKYPASCSHTLFTAYRMSAFSTGLNAWESSVTPPTVWPMAPRMNNPDAVFRSSCDAMMK